MRFLPLYISLAVVATSAHAGVIVGGTRLIYPAQKKEVSIRVNNPDSLDYLVQSWVDEEGTSQAKAPFLVTPPLFRLDGHSDNNLRVVNTNPALPQDRESLFWLNIKAIPSSSHAASVNTLQIAVKTRIKLIYRPTAVTGTPVEMGDKLHWQARGNNLIVDNPTPFYMNFQAVSINGHKVSNVTYARPKTQTTFTLPANISGSTIQWSLIGDYGTASHSWNQSLN